MQRLNCRRFCLRPGDALRRNQREAAHVAALQSMSACIPEEAGRAGGRLAQAARRTDVEVVLVAGHAHADGEEVQAAQVGRTQ